MHLRCYTCWWISNQFEQKWPQNKHERSQFTAKFDLTSGLFDLTSKQFYYVKVQCIPSQANFVLTRGMFLQAWSLQGGIPVFGFHLTFMRLRGMVKDCRCWKIKTFHENNFFDSLKTVVVGRLRPSMKITRVVVGRLRPSMIITRVVVGRLSPSREMGSKIATCRPAYRR